MRKYTQRELLSEALTSDVAKGLGSVALAGLKGAAKFITPSGAQLAKQLTSPFTKSKEIFASKQSKNAIEDYLRTNKTVAVFLKNILDKDIINNNIKPVTDRTSTTVSNVSPGVKKVSKSSQKNAEDHRLVFISSAEPVEIFKDVYKAQFIADSAYGRNNYIAYLRKNNNKLEVFALQKA